MLMAESEVLLREQVEAWKQSLEARGLRVNMGKTKVMRCQVGLRRAKKIASTDPCGVCGERVKRNSIQCSQCQRWIHKRCSGIKGKMRQDPTFKCRSCTDGVQGQGIDGELEMRGMMVGQEKLERVDKFCYLGDVIGEGGGAEAAAIARVRNAWAKFSELGSILKRRGASLRLKGKIYKVCVQRVMLYGSETWAEVRGDITRMERAEMSMVRWMCGVSLKDRIRNEDLRDRLGIRGVGEMVEVGRLRWFGHLERKDMDDMVSACRRVEVEGKRRVGRPLKTWEEGVRNSMRKCGVDAEMAKDRVVWEHCIWGKSSNPRKRGKT